MCLMCGSVGYGSQLADAGADKGSAPGSRSLDLKGKRDYAISSIPGRLCVTENGTGLPHGGGEPLGHRRSPRKGTCIRTMAIPVWVKQGVKA